MLNPQYRLCPDILWQWWRKGRNSRDQCLGVGMFWPIENILCPPRLYQPAPLHHGNPVSNLSHHAEVVGNEQNRRSFALLKFPDELQDLGLGCHIEGGGRLICDKDVRLKGQRHRDHCPLTLAA
jgi:hypothetical protein